jgi:hypothetical protein
MSRDESLTFPSNKSLVCIDERDDDDPPVSDNVLNAELPPETFHEYGLKRDQYFVKHGHLFKTYEDCEYFNMLPLSKKQKDHVLRRALELNSAPT